MVPGEHAYRLRLGRGEWRQLQRLVVVVSEVPISDLSARREPQAVMAREVVERLLEPFHAIGVARQVGMERDFLAPLSWHHRQLLSLARLALR